MILLKLAIRLAFFPQTLLIVLHARRPWPQLPA
jgi:hypothetical protein